MTDQIPPEPPDGLSPELWDKAIEAAAEDLYGYKTGWIDEKDIAHILRKALGVLAAEPAPPVTPAQMRHGKRYRATFEGIAYFPDPRHVDASWLGFEGYAPLSPFDLKAATRIEEIGGGS